MVEKHTLACLLLSLVQPCSVSCGRKGRVSSLLAFLPACLCENVFLMRSELFLSIFFSVLVALVFDSGLSVWLLMPHTAARMILDGLPPQTRLLLPLMLVALLWNFCTRPLCWYRYSDWLQSISFLDEWDRTATRESIEGCCDRLCPSRPRPRRTFGPAQRS